MHTGSFSHQSSQIKPENDKILGNSLYPIKSVYYVDMSVRIVEHGFAPSLMSPGGSKLRGPTVSYFPPALKTFSALKTHLLILSSLVPSSGTHCPCPEGEPRSAWPGRRWRLSSWSCSSPTRRWIRWFPRPLLLPPRPPRSYKPDQNGSRRSSTCLMVRGAEVRPVGASAKVWLRKSVMNQPEKPTSGEKPQTTNSS